MMRRHPRRGIAGAKIVKNLQVCKKNRILVRFFVWRIGNYFRNVVNLFRNGDNFFRDRDDFLGSNIPILHTIGGRAYPVRHYPVAIRLRTREEYAILCIALSPQSGDSSGAILEVPFKALLHGVRSVR